MLSPSGGDDEILLDVAAGEHLLLFEEGAVEELPFHEGVDDFLHLLDGDAWKFFEQDDIVFRCPFEVVSVAVDGAQEHDDGCLALDAVHHGDGADSGVIEKIYFKGEVIEACFDGSCHDSWVFVILNAVFACKINLNVRPWHVIFTTPCPRRHQRKASINTEMQRYREIEMMGG